MIQTTVRLERPEGTVLLRGIAVQIEEQDAREALDLEAARPYDLVTIYTTTGVPSIPLRRRDVLFDELNLDAETGQPAKYRIVATVETFESDHQEMLAERVVGA
jgi:hypothetical protein